MIWPILASVLGLVDTVTSVILQRTGTYREVGALSWFYGPTPKVWHFALGYVVITAALWGLYCGVSHWVVVPWLVVETYEVGRNVRFLAT